MATTLSAMKADIGSIGGHIAASRKLLEVVRATVQERSAGLLIDSAISHTGDDIAILLTHKLGAGDTAIHRLAWDAFVAGSAAAKA